VAGSCEHSNELARFKEGRILLKELRDSQLFKKFYALLQEGNYELTCKFTQESLLKFPNIYSNAKHKSLHFALAPF
jgi:hypothetical protein